MEFFKYDFKNTCFRLIFLLIIGTLWIWFLYQLNNIYSNDTTHFFFGHKHTCLINISDIRDNSIWVS